MDNYDSESNTNKTSKLKGFFSYVFDFNEQRKQELINLGQYITLGFIFHSILVYVVDISFPKIDDTNSSIEIIFTLLLYLYIIFYSVYFIDRIICYFHLFFGKSLYGSTTTHELLLFPLVTPIILAIISFNPQFQDGTHIIFERINNAWNGNEKKQKKKNKSNPQPQQPQMQQQMITQQPITNSLYSGNTTPINQLPVLQEGFTQQQQQQSQPVQQFTQDNSNTTGQEQFAPMAANEVMGGSFGSSFGSVF